ncbi:MAG TPA: hypothetical protein VD966_09760, partial [Pyrinomonadaceae bacterium]|nr:hypothetical protein [Pyrinomonadaceae bacterium]
SLPTLLSLSYLNTPNNGMVLTASMQVAGDALTYSADGKQAATVDLAGVVLNDQGKIAASFKNRLNVDRLSSGPAQHDGSGIIYNHRAPLEPGIYQVRVAARDVKSGRLGSAMQWLEIPNLSTRRLTLSSLLIGGQVLETAESTKGGNQSAPQVQFSVDHRFSRSSRLGFWVFVYNAARNGSGAPELTGQVQVFRNRQAVVNAPQRKLVTEGQADLARIPYGGELPLKALAAGQYELRVTITDHVAKTSASQSIDFEVE